MSATVEEEAESIEAPKKSLALTMALKGVRLVAIKPEKAKALVDQYKSQARKSNPGAPDEVIEKLVSQKIISRYAKMAGFSGGATGATGIIPGLGTVVAAIAGGSVDTAASTVMQINMTMCLAANYGWDLTDEDAVHMCFLIAVVGSMESFGASVGAPKLAQVGVKALRYHLKGARLVKLKSYLAPLGITFSRKGAEKTIPAGAGMAMSAGAGYLLTRFVGYCAVRCFTIDRAQKANPNLRPEDVPSDPDLEPNAKMA